MTNYPAFRKYGIPFEISPTGDFTEKLAAFKKLDLELRNARLVTRINLVKNLRKKWISLPESEESQREKKLVDGYKFVTGFIDFPLTELGQLNGLFRGNNEIPSLRSCPLFIRASQHQILREFPPHESLPELMNELIRWDQENQDILSSFILHFLLLSIHPYEDGNGRIARAVEWARLKKHGINFHPGWEPEVIMHWQSARYNVVLESSRSSGYVDEFISFMLDGYIETGKALILSGH